MTTLTVVTVDRYKHVCKTLQQLGHGSAVSALVRWAFTLYNPKNLQSSKSKGIDCGSPTSPSAFWTNKIWISVEDKYKQQILYALDIKLPLTSEKSRRGYSHHPVIRLLSDCSSGWSVLGSPPAFYLNIVITQHVITLWWNKMIIAWKYLIFRTNGRDEGGGGDGRWMAQHSNSINSS